MRDPARGEVWLVDLGMVAKVRPVLVLSIKMEDHDRALITIVPHTTSLRGSRFEVEVQGLALKTGAFDCQNLISIPKGKFLRKLGRLAAVDLTRIESAVAAWLGIANSSTLAGM